MSTVVAGVTGRRFFPPSFYFWIALVMSFFVFGGFSLAALARYLTNDPTTMPPVVHLHGVTFISWMTLLMVQTYLINVKNVALHRSLGTFGIALGTAVLFTGALISLLGLSNGDTSGPFYYDLTYLSIMALLGFGLLFTLAMRQTRKPEYHRRLILFATIPLLPPGINRMYQVGFQLDYLPVLATYLTMAAIATAILVHDWQTTGRINNASKIGSAVVFGQALLHWPVSNSAAFVKASSFLMGLVYYR
jgi:uncharacterized membrane protein